MATLSHQVASCRHQRRTTTRRTRLHVRAHPCPSRHACSVHTTAPRSARPDRSARASPRSLVPAAHPVLRGAPWSRLLSLSCVDSAYIVSSSTSSAHAVAPVVLSLKALCWCFVFASATSLHHYYQLMLPSASFLGELWCLLCMCTLVSPVLVGLHWCRRRGENSTASHSRGGGIESRRATNHATFACSCPSLACSHRGTSTLSPKRGRGPSELELGHCE